MLGYLRGAVENEDREATVGGLLIIEHNNEVKKSTHIFII
jgi:hypothetical protein